MCGIIAGIWEKGLEPSPGAFQAALRAIGHRGPDGSGQQRIEYGGHVGVIGHVRLAHVDLAGGAQPMAVAGEVYSVNGEIYGYAAMRAMLERKGATFASRSDSELIGHLREAAGRDPSLSFPGDLRGEWAFASLAAGEPVLTAACDAAGTKPLRIHAPSDGRCVIVASEAKALFALGAPRELDEEALRFAMAFQYLPFGRTLFKGVAMLPHAHAATFAPAGRRGALQGKAAPWTDPYRKLALGARISATVNDWNGGRSARRLMTPAEDRAYEAAGREDASDSAFLLALVEEAVALRIPSETGFGTHLSGGLDSSAILALAARATGRRDIPAFTAHFPWGGDEVPEAAATARAIGAEHVPVSMELPELLKAMDQAAHHAEGPAMNAHSGAKILIAEAMRERGLKCALTGEGADEAFYGYEHLRLDLFGTKGADTVQAQATDGVHRPRAGAPQIADRAFGLPVPTFVKAKAGMGQAMAPAFGERLLAAGDPTGLMAGMLPRRWLKALKRRHPAQVGRDLWSTYCLSGYILRGLDDACGMARGVESRLPFLDPVVQWAAERIAPASHFDGATGLEKNALRRALVGVVPADVLARPKAPFMAPRLSQTPEGAAWVRERVLGGRLTGSGLYGANGLEAVLAAPDSAMREACVTTLATLSAMMESHDLT